MLDESTIYLTHIDLIKKNKIYIFLYKLLAYYYVI